MIIPDANDSDDELKQMCDWVLEHVGDEVPVHFTAFHPDFKMMDRPRTPHETLLRGYEVARKTGIKFAYVGNVHDVEHQSTYCPSCRKLLIERDWHQLGRYHMNESSCGHCGQSIPGRFQTQPGTWGRKRQPVDLTPYAVSATNPPKANLHPNQSQLHPPPAQQVPGEGRAESEGRVGRATASSSNEEQRNEPSPLVPRDPPRIRSSLAKGRVSLDAKENLNPDTPVTHQIQVSSTMATDSTQTTTLTDEQGQEVFKAACELVAATLNNRQPAFDAGFQTVANLPVDGAFVSLKRSGRLRGCCGFVGQKATIGSAIAHAAKRTALEDPRLPPVSPSELPHLDCEVWLLQPPTRIHARGEDRIGEIQIGRDGLIIGRGNQRGLLLPGVATDLGLDAAGFLKQVCLKAKLPPDAWKDNNTILEKFEGQCVGGRFDSAVCESSNLQPVTALSADEFRTMVDFCRDNVILLGQGAVASCYINGVSDGMVNGITLTISRQNGAPAHITQLSLRPPMPMQSTIYSMAQKAAKLLSANNIPAHECQFDLTIFTDPAMHGTISQPDLAGLA
ncbi:MAG: AmmeMemoRadiSam system protein A, partial [Planctomycetota bacterium]